ncbi:Rad2 family nuclease EXO1 PWA37_003989 [Arxiozyma heterogenica]|uniref:Rad2 family nuclease EXO1 n=1 Tax=Arxiozyma heterogenica TaxID=278026 RepID=UPI002EE87E5E
MGIQGLLPQLKPIQNPVSLRRYEGQILGVDGYAWLHRAAYPCAHELVLGKPTEKYLQFFIKKISMLRSYKVEPYIVFDGSSIGVKKDTELKRRKKREENRVIAEKLWNSGDKARAMEYFQKCVDITPEMAKCIIDYCKTNHIKYVVAPFEADSQLVYLEKNGIIDGILSEDSDLLVFGCRTLITKLNDYGECIEICSDDFQQLKDKFPIGDISVDGVRTMVALSGCDYTDGIPKIGLLRAIKLVQRFNKMEKIINHIKLEGKLTVPSHFYEEYERANYSFQFQRVFCPQRRRIVTLNAISEKLQSIPSIAEKIAKSIGQAIHCATKERFYGLNSDEIDHELHEKIALGDLNPHDFNRPLVNREFRLQLSTKSEILSPSNSHLKTRIKNIENYFDINHSHNLVKPIRANSTIGTIGSALFHGMTQSSLQKSMNQESRLYSTISSLSENIQSSMQRKEQKTNRIINNRLLVVRAKRSFEYCQTSDENGDVPNKQSVTSVINNVSSNPKTVVSKFFNKSQEINKSSMLIEKTPQRFRCSTTNGDSEAETEVPESLLSTQVSTRSSSIISTDEDELPSDISEYSENECISNNDCNNTSDQEDSLNKKKQDELKARRLVGSKNMLEEFRYRSDSSTLMEERQIVRVPFSDVHPNKKDLLSINDINNKNNNLKNNTRRSLTKQKKAISSLVCTIKRSSSNDVGSNEDKRILDQTRNQNCVKRIRSSRGIKLKISRSSSQLSMQDDCGDITDDNMVQKIVKSGVEKTMRKENVMKSNKRTITSLSCFSYKES